MAKSKYSQAQAQLAQEKRAEGALERDLSRAMGLPLSRSFTIAETPVALTKIPDRNDIERIASAHPSVQKADAAVRVAQADVQKAQSKYGPTVTLGASAGFSDDDYTPSSNDSESLSLNLSWPLVDFGSRSAGVQKARAALRAAQAQAQQSRRDVGLEIEQAWNDYKDALEDDEVAQESLLAATERNKITKAQYEVGLSSYNDWTLIEDNFVSAQKAALQARLKALTTEAAWIQSRGEIYGEN